MAPFVLPSVFHIASVLDKNQFEKKIIRIITPLMTMTKPPDRAAQCMLIIIQYLDVLLQQSSPEFIQSHVLPMIAKGLGCGVTEIQETVLKQMPLIADKIEFQILKTSILPM